MKSKSSYSLIIIVLVLAAVAAVLASSHKKPERSVTPKRQEIKLPRMIELGSTHCIPCQKMAKITAQLEPEYKGRAKFEFIDVTKYPEQAQAFKIQLIPTQVFLDKDEKEIWRHVGVLEPEKIRAQFKKMGVQ